jgi:hypothetical protein
LKNLILTLVLTSFITFSFGQSMGESSSSFGQSMGESSSDVKYRRSSLHRILVESEKFPLKDTVISAYYNAPFPDKYNDHSIDEIALDLKNYQLSSENRIRT